MATSASNTGINAVTGDGPAISAIGTSAAGADAASTMIAFSGLISR